MMSFFVFRRSVSSLKSIHLVERWKLGEGIHKPAQSGVVTGTRWKLHCQVVAACTGFGIGSERKERTQKLV